MKVKKRKKRNPTKARGILTGPSKLRRRRIRSGKKISHKKRSGFKAKKKTRKAIVKKVKKATKTGENQSLQLLESFKPKIKVIGIGGGGGSIVSEIGRSLHKAHFVVADTDIRALKRRKGIKYITFGSALTHGLGTGLNVDLAKEAARAEQEKISELFEGQDIVIFVASLGGGVGSGATEVFLEAGKSFNGVVMGIFTLPFKFEGKSKQRIATKALKSLRKSLNVSITIPNERIFKVIKEDTPIVDAFSMVNKSLIESLESLIDLIQSPGLINIDFADLKAILQGRGNLAFFNTAEAAGKDKVDHIIKNVLHNPLYQDNFVPEKVLFNIEGGKSLSMFEVDRISKAISEKNPKAKIIFGISKNPKAKHKIKTTLLMTGPGVLSEFPAQTPKSIETKSRKLKKSYSKKKKAKAKEKILQPIMPVLQNLIPVFSPVGSDGGQVKKVSISQNAQESKKTIRRSALEIQKAEELQKAKKSKQEEEWEIPAFLRFKKGKL